METGFSFHLQGASWPDSLGCQVKALSLSWKPHENREFQSSWVPPLSHGSSSDSHGGMVGDHNILHKCTLQHTHSPSTQSSHRQMHWDPHLQVYTSIQGCYILKLHCCFTELLLFVNLRWEFVQYVKQFLIKPCRIFVGAAYFGVCVCLLSRFSSVQLLANLCTTALQAPLSTGFSR